MELDEMLSGILGNQDSMDKILDLVRTLGGEESSEQSGPPPGAPGPGASAGSGLLSFPEPETMDLVMRLFSAWTSTAQTEPARVLQAMRGAIDPGRREKIDRALRAVRIARMARTALGGEEGSGERDFKSIQSK